MSCSILHASRNPKSVVTPTPTPTLPLHPMPRPNPNHARRRDARKRQRRKIRRESVRMQHQDRIRRIHRRRRRNRVSSGRMRRSRSERRSRVMRPRRSHDGEAKLHSIIHRRSLMPVPATSLNITVLLLPVRCMHTEHVQSHACHHVMSSGCVACNAAHA